VTPTAPLTPMTPVAAVHATVVGNDHLIGKSQSVWRHGYQFKEISVIEAEIQRIESIFTEAGADVIDVWPKSSPSLPTADSASSSSSTDRMAALLKALVIPSSCRMLFAQRVTPAMTGSSVEPLPITTISKKAVLSYYDTYFKYASPSRRVFNLIRATEEQQSLTPTDWYPLIRFIADTHSGLAFLRDSGDFLPRYVDTVIVRLFHGARSSRVLAAYGPGRAPPQPIAAALLSHGLHTYSGSRSRKRWQMSFRDFDDAGLASLLHEVDSLPELTRYPNHFDYVSFYTIYCKFWELDTDRDLLLRKEDLIKYDTYALSSRIVDRVFDVCRFNVPLPKISSSESSAQTTGDSFGAPHLDSTTPAAEAPMTFQDFVYFVLCNVDSSACSSVELWFHCLDVDGDGYLSPHDLFYIYEDQQRRMEFATMEVLPFEHAYTQMLDMIKPKDLNRISLRELKESGQSPDIFHLLFNLSEFESDEQRYPLDQTLAKEIVAVVDACDLQIATHSGASADSTAAREVTMRHLHASKWYQWALSQYQLALGDDSNGASEAENSMTPSSHDEDEDPDPDEDDDESATSEEE
jgi:hypothetical protein